MTLRIDVSSLRMNDDTADSDGVLWGVNAFDGWDNPVISPDVSRLTGRNGAAMLESRYQQRSMVLSGDAIAPSETASWAASNKLSALVPLMTPVTLSVYETVTKSLDVVAAGPARIRLSASLIYFEWELPLLALNPFKRGATHTVTLAAGASTTIAYVGTAVGFPTVTLTSSGTVNLANSTTSTHVTTSSLASGAVIDNYARTIYAGTVNRYSTLAAGVAWLTLLPGNNAVANTGTANLSIQFYDLYL